MPINIGLYSYGTACLAYTLLAGVLLLGLRNLRLSLGILVATVFTAAWAGLIAFATLLPYPPVELLQFAEVARNAAWLFLLLKIYGTRLHGTDHLLGSRRWLSWYLAGLAVILVILFAIPLLDSLFDLPPSLVRSVTFCVWTTMSLVGVLVLENIYRNSTYTERWWARYLCMGVGFLFAYDFFMYAGAIMLQQLDPALWQSRGFAIALTAPLVAVAAVRSRGDTTQVKRSRHLVFHTFTLLAAGIYLISMGIVGFVVSKFGGAWSSVLQITFLSATGLFLLVLLLSGRLRARSRVWLSRNFFSYKYDYRQEWLEFTETLAAGGDNPPLAIIQAMARMGNCRAGLLWSNSSEEGGQLIEEWQTTAAAERGDFTPVFDWLRDTGWIIDVQEWRETPQAYSGLVLPSALAEAPGAWLVVPLMFSNRLEGILVLLRAKPYTRLNWEDLDLLKVAGGQAAVHLAQYRASQSLVELRQFEAFNRLSAYVIHDLKNILAEQSLIVSNAARHRGNLEFYDDVIATVADSVERMNALMVQMHKGMRGGESEIVALGALLREVVAARPDSLPQPLLQACPDAELWVKADREQLATVFGHIIQNARDATSKNGCISVHLLREGDLAVVEIKDDGIGMSPEFIKHRLFKPFDSTKGLTGMGIGVFESREVLHSLGGEMEVHSEQGVGSCFRIVLPCVTTDLERLEMSR